MLNFILQLLAIAIVTFGTEKLAYKYVRHIDKKERKKLQEWEKAYILSIKAGDK